MQEEGTRTEADCTPSSRSSGINSALKGRGVVSRPIASSPKIINIENARLRALLCASRQGYCGEARAKAQRDERSAIGIVRQFGLLLRGHL